jgi:hypothetical protein
MTEVTLTDIDAGHERNTSAQVALAMPPDQDASLPVTLAEALETSPGDGHAPFTVVAVAACELPETTDSQLGEAPVESQPAEPDPPPPEVAGPARETVEDVSDEPAVVSPTALVDALLDVAAPRRNKRRQVADVRPEAGPERSDSPVVAQHDGPGGADEESPARVEPASTTPSADDPDDPAWRDQWPDNAVHIVAHVLPRISDAPALDGVQRTRLDLSLASSTMESSARLAPCRSL